MDHLHTIICSKHIHTNIKITNIETKRRVPNFLRNPYYKNQKILLPVKILNLIEMWATIQVVRLECSQPKGLRSIRKQYSQASKKKKKPFSSKIRRCLRISRRRLSGPNNNERLSFFESKMRSDNKEAVGLTAMHCPLFFSLLSDTLQTSYADNCL